MKGKGPGSIRFGQGLRRLKLSVVPIVSRISDTKFKIVASASDASAILKCSNRRFTPEEWKVSGESFQITSFEEAKRQQTYSFVIKNVETSITIKEIEQELKLHLTNFKVTRIVSAKTGLPSPLIRVITNNKDEADKCIANGISLAYLHHPCEPSHQRVLQCNKCLKLGHTAGRCLSQLTCLRCGEIGHLATVCKAKEEKCALCGGPHVAVADNCPKRQEFALKHKAQQQQHQYQQQQQQQPSGRTMNGIFLWLSIPPLRGGSVLLHFNINNNNNNTTSCLSAWLCLPTCGCPNACHPCQYHQCTGNLSR